MFFPLPELFDRISEPRFAVIMFVQRNVFRKEATVDLLFMCTYICI